MNRTEHDETGVLALFRKGPAPEAVKLDVLAAKVRKMLQYGEIRKYDPSNTATGRMALVAIMLGRDGNAKRSQFGKLPEVSQAQLDRPAGALRLLDIEHGMILPDMGVKVCKSSVDNLKSGMVKAFDIDPESFSIVYIPGYNA